jgi:hypothetical protein
MRLKLERENTTEERNTKRKAQRPRLFQMDDLSSNLEESKEVGDCDVPCWFSGATWRQSASRSGWIK